MVRLRNLGRLREHPRFWMGLALLIGLVIGSGIFSFFTGFYPLQLLVGGRPVSQTIVTVESISNLNAAPILLLPTGSRLLNSTYNVAVQGSITVYMWVLEFQNSSIHPTRILEPAYVYWQAGLVPLTFSLYAVYVRFHFFARLVYGGWTLNGTRIFISYSPAFFVPTVAGGVLQSLLKPRNATVVSSYTPLLDPALPYSSLSPATPQYTPDPWVVLSSPETILNGLLLGSLGGAPFGLASYVLILVTVHPRAPRHRVRIRKRILPLLEKYLLET